MTLVNRCTQYICTYIALSELQDGLDGEGVALCASGQGRLEFHHLRDRSCSPARFPEELCADGKKNPKKPWTHTVKYTSMEILYRDIATGLHI